MYEEYKILRENLTARDAYAYARWRTDFSLPTLFEPWRWGVVALGGYAAS